jgi:predicted unusual protein kinase regulating ubiquinone biosynthesis (AarF/ABC1/UbiB family)
MVMRKRMDRTARSHSNGTPLLPTDASPVMSAGCRPPSTASNIDRRRFRRIWLFFLRVLLQTAWWDGLFRLPLLYLLRPAPRPRWQAIARRYRKIATEMGGVLIKFGQFLSTRVDLLPPEITQELAGLQDEVPPAPTAAVIGVVAEAFGCPVEQVFRDFEPFPIGAASLAQAHRAVLPDGHNVIVKVLRPGIHVLVETDLRAMRRICRWLQIFQFIRQRMDLEVLLAEFTQTTRCELDLQQENENLKRFASDFADDPHVYIPQVFEDYCRRSVLTLENVAYIKITDIDGLEAAGIKPSAVADRLYETYMHQIFITNFVHVDPHPGNLFVRPLPTPAETTAGQEGFSPGEQIPYEPQRPFQLVFIDFGMTAKISERLKVAMRMAAIGISTQDSRKVVQAYIVAGALRPGTDQRRLEEAHQEWLQKIWGLRLGKIQETAFRELSLFVREYRDLIVGTTFQLQADMLFIGRAVGILTGLATRIDPEFDPWTKTMPYAKRFAMEEFSGEWQGLGEEVFMLVRQLWRIPGQLEQVLTRAKQGALTVQVSLSPETRQAIRRIDMSVRRFAWMVLTAGLMVAGVNLHIADKNPPLGIVMIGLSAVAFLWGMGRK